MAHLGYEGDVLCRFGWHRRQSHDQRESRVERQTSKLGRCSAAEALRDRRINDFFDSGVSADREAKYVPFFQNLVYVQSQFIWHVWALIGHFGWTDFSRGARI